MEVTSFRKLFGSSPFVRLIDFFLDNREFDYSLADFMREEGISYVIIKPVWDQCIQNGILEKTRREGKADYYCLSHKHPLVKKLVEIDALVADHYLAAELKKQQSLVLQ